MMNPELRRRFVNSIEYLRRMDFFNDYSNLSSEEILDKIFSGEIDYESQWFVEEAIERDREEELKIRRKLGIKPYGVILKESIEKGEKYWMKKNDFEIDVEIARFDKKRFFVEVYKTTPRKNMGLYLIKKLARISRGVFQPTGMREEWSKWESDEVPPELRKYIIRVSYPYWSRCRVFFKFQGGEHFVDFYCERKILIMEPVVEKINELIKNSGYQYYKIRLIPNCFEYAYYIAFVPAEVEKLEKERSWKLQLMI